jgi:hypothetical protein
MKSNRIPVWLLGLARILYCASLVGLVLLLLGILAASVSAKPVSSPPVQGLPTRPPPSKPEPKPPTEPDSQPPTPMPSPTPTPRPAPYVDVTFDELGHTTFQLSESGSRGIDVYLPSNFAPDNDTSYLDLIISHIPPEPDKLSVVRLTLNGTPLAVITLKPEDAASTTHRFYLRDAPLAPGNNRLDISLDSGAVCNVRGAQVDVVIYGQSSFHVEYSLVPHSPDLARYPIPFFEPSFEHEPVYIVLPDNPSVTDMSAAATIAAGLGKFSDGEIRLRSALDTQIATEIRNNHHLIVVGKKGPNRFLDLLNLSARDEPVLSDGQGVIQEIVSPWNPLRMILLVTGSDDTGLAQASQALNREARLLGMQGPVAIVQTVFLPEPVESRQLGVDFTLADLGYEEEVVYGTRPHILDYHFDMPLGFAVTEEARFTLHFGHAEIASPANSSLNVQFNGVPIDSVLLDESNASEGALEVLLPSWLIRAGRNAVRVSVEMNLDDEEKCMFLDIEQLWTAIYSDSSFHLPFTSQDLESSLDLFPYPFDERPNLSGLLLILPDRPGELDYDLMLQVSAGLGAADQGDSLALTVTTADLVTQEDREDRDLILIGRPSVHSAIAELNDRLPQPFEAGSDLLRSQVESMLLAQDPSRAIGLIQELAAPWDPERTILVLTGTTDEGVAMAAETLLSESDELTGNVAVVEESVGVRAFDTRSLLSTSGGWADGPDAHQALLAQLSERWW